MSLYKYLVHLYYQIIIYFGINYLFSKKNNTNKNFNFKVFKQINKARRGAIYTPHGIIQTPAFIFCATRASMKSTSIQDVINNKSQIILSNTYHLFLKGYDKIKKLGGLHQALGFNKPMLTDSGGYQIFAMNFQGVSSDIKGSKQQNFKPTLISVDDSKAVFRSYYNKQKMILNPEISIQVQIDLGADLIVAFDECTSSSLDYQGTKKSLERSNLWEKQSLEYFKKHTNKNQAMYGVVQGGIYQDLRKISCDFINQNDFFGIAVGGCLGNTQQQMYQTVNFTMEHLVKDRPVHLLGIGYIQDIFNGVNQGIDTFDCVHPTRIARHGYALVKFNKNHTLKENKTNSIKIGHQKFENVLQPIDSCYCTTCKTYKLSYLHLLIKMKEHQVYQLITNHNIFFMNQLMEDIRFGIETNTLEQIKQEYLN